MKKQSTGIALVLLNAFALIFYFVILPRLHPINSIPTSLFQTGDSREYLEYSQWLGGNSDYCSPVRTFFYPLVILTTTSLFGNYGLWVLQFLFWLVSCNLTFFIIHTLTGNRVLAAIGFFLYCTMVSVIGYTSHALTETTVSLLVSLLLFTLAKNSHRINTIQVQLQLLFIISLLAVTKPVYQAIWYISMAIIIFVSSRELKQLKIILFLLLAISPVLVQKSISLTTCNTLSSTGIVDSNLKNYLYRKTHHLTVYGTISNFDFVDDSIHDMERKAACKISSYEAVIFLIKHPKQTFLTIIDNLQDNIGSGYPYANSPVTRALYKWSQNINNKIMYLHLAAFIMWLLFVFKFFRQPKTDKSLFIFLAGLLLFYILLSSALTFWSGDRLVAPVTTLWICCYLVGGQTLFFHYTRLFLK